jgi:hypothetical protein
LNQQLLLLLPITNHYPLMCCMLLLASCTKLQGVMPRISAASQAFAASMLQAMFQIQ